MQIIWSSARKAVRWQLLMKTNCKEIPEKCSNRWNFLQKVSCKFYFVYFRSSECWNCKLVGVFRIGVLLLTPASYCLDGMKIRGQVKLKIHSLEALGVAVVPISRLGFTSLPDHEKIPYLANKINSRTFARNLDLDVRF